MTKGGKKKPTKKKRDLRAGSPITIGGAGAFMYIKYSEAEFANNPAPGVHTGDGTIESVELIGNSKPGTYSAPDDGTMTIKVNYK